MRLSTLFTSGWIIASLAGATGALAADAPSVDSILTKYVDALGGKAAREKINSRVIKFKIESETIGASQGEIYAKGPNKQLSHIELAGGSGTINEGFDGAVAWAKTPWEDLRVKTGDELAKIKRDAEFHRDLKLKSLFPDLAFKGTEKVGDEEAYVLEAKPSASSKEKFWFSAKSGLLLRQDSEFEGPQGVVKTTLLPQDYKTVEGLKYADKLKLKYSAGGQTFEFTMQFLEIQHNVKIDDAKFAKPSA